jgi:phosphatidylglycerol:prolipoprotein diacylglycerol transferase
MHPILFQIGPVTIPTYGALVALGMILGLTLSLRLARRDGLDPDAVENLAFVVLLAGLIGARLWFVAIAWDHYRSHPWDVFRLWEGGLVFYGGLIPGILTAVAYMGIKRMPMFAVGDVLAPGLAIGQAVGRLGCLAAGCCYGRETGLPWAVIFTHPHSLAPQGIPLHPTQLYDALTLGLLFTGLMVLRRFSRRPGLVFWTYAFLQGLGRFLLEPLRNDFRGVSLWGEITSTRGAALGLMVVSTVILAVLVRSRSAVRDGR